MWAAAGAMLIVSTAQAVAGQGFYITVENRGKSPATMRGASSQAWYAYDLGREWTVQPGEKIQLYSEACESIFGCVDDADADDRLKEDAKTRKFIEVKIAYHLLDSKIFRINQRHQGLDVSIRLICSSRASHQNISMRKDGKQFRGTVVITEDSISCE